MQPRWLVVGRVTAPFGISGELRVFLQTDFPEQLPKRSLYIGETKRKVRVTAIRLHRGQALLRIEGVETREAAELLRGEDLFIATEDAASLPEGRYYIYQLIDMPVILADTGERYGTLKNVLTLPANDVFVIERNGREELLPAVHSVIRAIDLDHQRIIITPPAETP
ncbi:MAG: ribosome maturation factor RimM [Chloroflexi bacterium]|nr:ribosome maturation factor RimM [Chloroflexota bacterium]